MKKIILTENQVKNLLKGVISEQNIENDANKVIQCFLNQLFKANYPVDGIMGENSSRLIEKYQMLRGVPADGIWGELTASKVKGNKSDFDLMKKCGYQYRDILDKIFMYLGILDY